MTNETPRPLLLPQVRRATPDFSRHRNLVAGIRMFALLRYAYPNLDHTEQRVVE